MTTQQTTENLKPIRYNKDGTPRKTPKPYKKCLNRKPRPTGLKYNVAPKVDEHGNVIPKPKKNRPTGLKYNTKKKQLTAQEQAKVEEFKTEHLLGILFKILKSENHEASGTKLSKTYIKKHYGKAAVEVYEQYVWCRSTVDMTIIRQINSRLRRKMIDQTHAERSLVSAFTWKYKVHFGKIFEVKKMLTDAGYVL